MQQPNDAVTHSEGARITAALLRILREVHHLHGNGIHGLTHWQRVRENGLRLSAATGADLAVVEYFAYLHDVRRFNDGYDPQHGPRAAGLAVALRKRALHLEDRQFDLLLYACSHHTDELTHPDITIRTCWDADRLDLARVDIIPDPKRLCTEAARDPAVRAWAIRRSRAKPSNR